MEQSFNQRLLERCNETNNRLCIGLDIDLEKLPKNVSDFNSAEVFIKEIIDSTIDFCPVYKPNLAFYERFGSKGFVKEIFSSSVQAKKNSTILLLYKNLRFTRRILMR